VGRCFLGKPPQPLAYCPDTSMIRAESDSSNVCSGARIVDGSSPGSVTTARSRDERARERDRGERDTDRDRDEHVPARRGDELEGDRHGRSCTNVRAILAALVVRSSEIAPQWMPAAGSVASTLLTHTAG
jgi:hypothetical protein